MTLSKPQMIDSMCYIVTIVKNRTTEYESHALKGNALAHRWLKTQHHDIPDGEGEQDDAHEDFDLQRRADCSLTGGYHYTTTLTRGKPYALAVRAAMILARHYFPTETFIASADATAAEWTTGQHERPPDREERDGRSAAPFFACPSVSPSPRRAVPRVPLDPPGSHAPHARVPQSVRRRALLSVPHHQP
jgi:hypothetical protein